MIMFNCGLSAAELFTNVPQKIVVHDYDWFRKKTGVNKDTVEEYAGYIFAGAFKLIIQTIIRDKVRFVSSFYNSYIDFVTVDDMDFMRDRQNGRFTDINIVESGFKGYQLMYHWRGSFKDVTRYKKMMLYMNVDMKQSFIDRINSGEVFYSIKDIRTKDILPDLKKIFPKLSKVVLGKITEYGFTRIFHAMKQQCSINVCSKNFGLYTYIGRTAFDRAKWTKEYYFRMRMKLIKISKWNEDKPTQYYYIALTDERMKYWARLNNKSNKAGWCWVWFDKCIARRLLKTALCNSTKSHIFEIKVRKKDMRYWHLPIEMTKYRDVEYLGESHNYVLKRSSKHWKDLVKEYKDKPFRNEERNS